jgi:hypothetical protein
VVPSSRIRRARGRSGRRWTSGSCMCDFLSRPCDRDVPDNP